MSNKLLVVGLFLVFANLFFFQQLGSMAFVLFFLGCATFLYSLFPYKGSKNVAYSISIFFISLLFILLTRSQGFVVFVIFISILAMLSAYVYIASTGILFFRSWFEILLSPLQNMKEYFLSWNRAYQQISLPKVKIGNMISLQGKTTKSVIGGLIIGIPLVLFLVAILSSADPIYGNILKQIFSFHISFSSILIQRMIFSAILFFILFPLTALTAAKHIKTAFHQDKSLAFSTESLVVLSLVAVVLASFLLVQFRYVFIGVPMETSLIQFGVNTYSEYVRRGFFELVFVSCIVFGTGVIAHIASRSAHMNERKRVGIAIQVVLGELIIFILSLFKRVFTYQSLHGWSISRMYGGMFLAWLCILTITFILRQTTKTKWMLKEVVITAVFLVVFGLVNIEGFIATSGHPPTVNNRVDYVYLSRMSPDGYAGWKMAYDYAQSILLDPKYQSQEIIGTDDRREIVYAGIVVGELTENYNNLVLHNGTREDVLHYLKSVVLYEKEQNTENNFEDPFIEKLLVQLENPNPSEIKATVDAFPPQRWFSEQEFAPDWLLLNVREHNRNVLPSSLSTVYRWNISKYTTFNSMKRDIPLDNLKELQKQYAKLWKQIAKQPEGEREYEFDISLRSPFLD